MNHKGTVTLETERLILRRFRMEDAGAMLRNWADDPEVTKYLTWPAHANISVSKAVLNSWIELYQKPEHYSWAIVLKEIDEPIGSIAAVKQSDDINMVHIGYCIGRKWWRKGYTSEALSRLVKFFFEDVKVNRIESRHDPNNANSGKVMQKAGLRYEGTLLESDRNNQGICDAARYAILARDYFKDLPSALPAEFSARKAIHTDIETVTELLCELYCMNRDALQEENKHHFSDERQEFFLAFAGDKPIGISHVSLRSEYVNGTELGGTCGYLKAIYVRPAYRKNGIAANLVHLCEDWAKERGCHEFASDCLLHNTDSYL